MLWFSKKNEKQRMERLSLFFFLISLLAFAGMKNKTKVFSFFPYIFCIYLYMYIF